MINKKEIEQLAEQLYPISPNPQQIIEGFERVAFKNGYTQCQKDMADKKYTEEDIKKAIELARETESVRRGALSEDWDDIEKYDEMDIIYLLNKQD